MISRGDVEAARERIRSRVRHTPLLPVGADFGGRAWLKLEHLQHTGTFKARGAFARILGAADDGLLDPEVGVVVASGGNAGLANAFAARALGVPATVFVPEKAPPVKVRRLRELGADVVLRGNEYAAAHAAATEHAQTTGALYCHAYDQPAIAAGAGTLALEVMEDLRGEVDSIVVAVGGGGLMAGVAAAVEGRAGVVGVEPRTCPTLHAALAEGRPTDVSVSGVAADSLGARRLGDIAFDVATRTRVHPVLVGDDDVVRARRMLWQEYRIAAEHGAATALAALAGGAYRPAAGERLVVVVCGANTDLTTLDD
ncbi:threonine/serine dehydratase [Nocardioides sp. GCM10027113]|uniref:threonine/serine dehydratase n=1 Tax=unclassified Nocardioides TaxID=2615069 RepID=UPI0036206071